MGQCGPLPRARPPRVSGRVSHAILLEMARVIAAAGGLGNDAERPVHRVRTDPCSGPFGCRTPRQATALTAVGFSRRCATLRPVYSSNPGPLNVILPAPKKADSTINRKAFRYVCERVSATSGMGGTPFRWSASCDVIISDKVWRLASDGCWHPAGGERRCAKAASGVRRRSRTR